MHQSYRACIMGSLDVVQYIWWNLLELEFVFMIFMGRNDKLSILSYLGNRKKQKRKKISIRCQKRKNSVMKAQGEFYVQHQNNCLTKHSH